MLICMITVLSFTPGETTGQSEGNFGPYATRSEAETALKDAGWKQVAKGSLEWHIGKVAGDGNAKSAHVVLTPCRPRIHLPRA
jgi:hypothetical protein